MTNELPGPGPGFWYLAGPYSDAPPLRVREHQNAAAYLIRAGVRVFSTISQWHDIAQQHSLPTDAKSWEEYNHGMVLASRGLIVLEAPGWQLSKGTRAEILCAFGGGIPVWGLQPPTSLLFQWRRLRPPGA